MAQLLVRDLDPAVVARLKEQARQNHRSLQGEVKAILEEAAARATRDEALAMIDRWQRRWGDRVFSDSTPADPGGSGPAVIRLVVDASVAVKWVLKEPIRTPLDASSSKRTAGAGPAVGRAWQRALAPAASGDSQPRDRSRAAATIAAGHRWRDSQGPLCCRHEVGMRAASASRPPADPALAAEADRPS